MLQVGHLSTMRFFSAQKQTDYISSTSPFYKYKSKFLSFQQVKIYLSGLWTRQLLVFVLSRLSVAPISMSATDVAGAAKSKNSFQLQLPLFRGHFFFLSMICLFIRRQNSIFADGFPILSSSSFCHFLHSTNFRFDLFNKNILQG